MSTLRQRQYPNQQRINEELARARYAERVEAERLAQEAEFADSAEQLHREIAGASRGFEEIPLLEEGPLSQVGMYNSAEIAAGNLARGLARSVVGGAVESAVGGGALGYTARAIAGGVAGGVANSAARSAARQAPQVAGRLGAYFDPIYRVFRPVFNSPIARTLGRGIKGAFTAEAGVALAMGELTYKGLNMIFDEQDLEKRKKKMRDQGYLVLDSEGTHEVQPRGDESLSKYTQISPNPTERTKPTKPKEPIIYVTPEPVTPDETKEPIIPPREPPITPVIPPRQPPPVKPPTTVTPPVRPPTTVTPPVRPPVTPPVRPPVTPPVTPVTPPQVIGSEPKTTNSFQIVTHQQGQSDRGLYMGPRPVKPIHYRIPNNRPYDMVDWERGARAKALAMVQ